MRREEKKVIIDSLAEKLQQYPNFYVTDTEGLNAEKTAKLRRLCFDKNVKMVIVKNTLFIKALEQVNCVDEQLTGSLKGTSAIMFCETANAAAKLIKEFRSGSNDKPTLKAAYVQECVYVGESQLDTLATIKSREEMLAEIISMLQAPARNVVSALQAGAGQKIAGLVKALEERGQN
jgi:large subunit ribosomal protein L10